MTRSFVSLSFGALVWTTYFRSPASLEHAEVFAWVADRDAGCVVALDQDLLELEAWVVSRPTALVCTDRGLFVKETRETTEEVWWFLEEGSLPRRCGAPGGDGDMLTEPDLSTPVLQGVPTAWAQTGCSLLVATPGAVHLFSEAGDLERVQGGFRWISDVVVSGQTAP